MLTHFIRILHIYSKLNYISSLLLCVQKLKVNSYIKEVQIKVDDTQFSNRNSNTQTDTSYFQAFLNKILLTFKKGHKIILAYSTEKNANFFPINVLYKIFQNF